MSKDIENLIKKYLEKKGYLVRSVHLQDELDDGKGIIDIQTRLQIRAMRATKEQIKKYKNDLQEL